MFEPDTSPIEETPFPPIEAVVQNIPPKIKKRVVFAPTTPSETMHLNTDPDNPGSRSHSKRSIAYLNPLDEEVDVIESDTNSNRTSQIFKSQISNHQNDPFKEKNEDETPKGETEEQREGKKGLKKKFYLRGILKQEGINIDEDVLDKGRDPR